jgi:diguanylate cyclase (GGDEF)-like protein
VLPSTDADTARNVCERIVAAFENTEHVIGPDRAKVTISVGCATHGGDTSFANAADFVKAADQALHAAKRRGRNRSVPFDRHMAAALTARQA